MKNLVQLLILSMASYLGACGFEETSTIEFPEQETEVLSTELDEPTYTSDEAMQDLFDNHVSDEQVLIGGEVIKTLPDDNEGSRHQKFIVEIASGQTFLVSHNIDLANRIDDLKEGDQVKVYGEYEWNDRGGVIHWTHHDPDGRHVDGWIEHENNFYE